MEFTEKLSSFCHPWYEDNLADMQKFRLTMRGGRAFIDEYLVKFSKQEDETDFEARKKITYNPAFAKSALINIRNSIFQRMIDVSRVNGTDSYQKAINGEGKGVDLNGSSMNYFLGQKVLLELMSMSRVGILVDRKKDILGKTKADTLAVAPYLYVYKAEDIRHWSYDEEGSLSAVLLEERRAKQHDLLSLTVDCNEGYRFLAKEVVNGVQKVYYKVVNSKNELVEQGFLDIPEIPFVLAEIENSLLRDVADYQIAMMNLSSSDLNYGLKSNFPFLVENIRGSARGNHVKDNQSTIKIGSLSGRGYLEGLNAPAFINPSADPLRASMAKQDQMKAEIFELINIALLEMGDGRGLESGLSYIGLELERVEKQIAKIWSSYEKDKNIAIVKYPNNYTIKSDKERYDETEQLSEIRKAVPSLTYRKEITKLMIEATLSGKVDSDTIKQINTEIDTAPVIITDPDKVLHDHESGLVGDKLASKISGYPEGEYLVAKEDRKERLEQTLLTQIKFGRKGKNNQDNLGARGVDDSVEGKEDAQGEKEVNGIIKKAGK